MAEFEIIEKLVDEHSVNKVLMLLGQVCTARAERLQEHKGVARHWIRAAAHIRQCRDSLPNVGGIK